jgi:capsule polysaccharide export protein KpsE/RkpR
MPITAETVNSRVKNLRAEATAHARALQTHINRITKASGNLGSSVDDLTMYVGNPKVERTEAEAAYDAKLSALFSADGTVDHDALKGFLAELDAAAAAEVTAEPTAEAATETPEPTAEAVTEPEATGSSRKGRNRSAEANA